jgi:hypothetical protein
VRSAGYNAFMHATPKSSVQTCATENSAALKIARCIEDIMPADGMVAARSLRGLRLALLKAAYKNIKRPHI